MTLNEFKTKLSELFPEAEIQYLYNESEVVDVCVIEGNKKTYFNANPRTIRESRLEYLKTCHTDSGFVEKFEEYAH